MYNNYISKRYIPIIASLLFVGLIFRISYDYEQTKNMVDKELMKIDKEISLFLSGHLKHLDTQYSSIAKNYQNNQRFIQLIKSKNTQDLYKEFEIDYKSMQELDPYLYIMHIFDTNNTTILRMHKPESLQDNLTHLRPMLRNTNKEKKTNKGFEVGKNGITYRITTPLIVEGNEHVGVLEFGVNLEYFMDKITDIIGGEAQLLVKTKSLEVLNKNINTKRFGTYSLVGNSKYFDRLSTTLDLTKEYQTIDIDEKTFVVFNHFNLLNYKDTHLKEAKIIFYKDITSLTSTHKKSLFMIYGINFLLILSIIIIFLTAIKARRKLQSSLKELNTTLEQKVEQRTDEQNVLLSLFDTGASVLFKWKNNDLSDVVYVSLGVEELLGYKKEEFLNHTVSLHSCIHPQDKERIGKDIQEASVSGTNYFKHESYRVITKSQEIKWVVEYTVIVKDKTNNITHYIGHISDITEQKNIEGKLLIQSRMAQMGEMISMIAHQWRQPLSSIASTAGNMKFKLELQSFDVSSEEGREKQESFMHEELENIQKYVQLLTHTIDDFRNFYKPNKQVIRIKLEDIVEKSLEVFKPILLQHNIQYETNYNNAKEIEVYDSELMQAVLNILKNAQDNILDKEIVDPKISIVTDTYRITISDNAGGILEEIKDKIYDPYFSTKGEKNGTGLGLYMSKIIIEKHHSGKLSMENKDGGACFIIDLNGV